MTTYMTLSMFHSPPANVAKLPELVRNLRGALLHLAQLGFRSGHTSRRERNPAGAVAQFGVLEPALVSGIVQSCIEFVPLQTYLRSHVHNPVIGYRLIQICLFGR